MDRHSRSHILGQPPRLQGCYSSTLSPPIQYQQHFQVFDMGNVLPRLRLSVQQLLDANFRLLAIRQILEPGAGRPLHQLRGSRPCIRCHEPRLRFPRLYLTAPDDLADESLVEGESGCVGDIHGWSPVCSEKYRFYSHLIHGCCTDHFQKHLRRSGRSIRFHRTT